MTRKLKVGAAEKGTEMAKMDAALKRIQQRQDEAMKASVIQFPLWPADLVGMPHVLVRNAIFRVIEHTKDEERDFVIDQVIASSTGPSEQIRIWFTGRVLSQQDQDFLEIALYALGKPDAKYVEVDGTKMLAITGYSLLKQAGSKTNSRDYHRLSQAMIRMRECALRIVIDRPGKEQIDVGGPLLLVAREGEGNKGKYLLRINPFLKPFFTPGNYSLVNIDLRRQLGSDTAKWLLGFYSTHAKPVQYSLDKLQTLCGSKYQHKGGWKRQVVKALDELVRIGFLTSYDIDAQNNVHVIRNPAHVTRHQLKSLDTPKKSNVASEDSSQQSFF